ncbi:MAG: hypothetical protein LBS84_01290 [Clostridiales bacterium]|nr:hypothetical protein [Clostridiales bacterium]
MLSEKNGVKFLVAAPCGGKYIKNQIEQIRPSIDQASNAIRLGDDEMILGVTRERVWGKEHGVYVHTFYNGKSAEQAKMDLYREVNDLADLARENPDNERYAKMFKKYLLINRGAKDVVEKAFCRFKNSMDFGRTRVHSGESLQNKIMIGFVALIIMSYIHKVIEGF